MQLGMRRAALTVGGAMSICSVATQALSAQQSQIQRAQAQVARLKAENDSLRKLIRVQAVNDTSISGSIFLLMKSGDTRRGEGLTVYLYPAISADTQASITAICRQMEARGAELTKKFWAYSDSGDAKQLMSSLAYERSSAARDSTKAMEIVGVDAISRLRFATPTARVNTALQPRYAFTRVSPGDYILRADWVIGSRTYHWEELVTVADKPIPLDLTGDNERGGYYPLRLWCPDYDAQRNAPRPRR